MKRHAVAASVALVACLSFDVTTVAAQVPGWTSPFRSLLHHPPRLEVHPGFSFLACCAAERTLDARLLWPDGDDGTGAALLLNAGLTMGGGRSYRRAGVGGRLAQAAGPVSYTVSASASAGSGAGPQQVYSVVFGAGLPALTLDVRTTWFGDSRSDSLYTAGDGSLSLARPVGYGNYTDGELVAQHRFGNARLQLTGGMRFGGAAGTTPEWLWGEAAVPVRRGVSLVLAGGIRPERVELAQPGGRFTQLSIRFDIGPAAPPAPVLAPDPAPPFSVTALGPNRYRLRLRVERARTVELTGDVTDWEIVALRKAPDGRGAWDTVLETAPGLYHINIRVDGGPWYVPEGFPAVPDGFGGVTGLLTLQPIEEDHDAKP